jgi:hypothetical protein
MNDDNNLLIIMENSFEEIIIHVFYYIDWYPHVKYFYQNDFDNISYLHFYEEIGKIIQLNDNRKWDIFKPKYLKVEQFLNFDDFIIDHLQDKYQKSNLEFNDFILDFILNNNKLSNEIKKPFITKKNQEILNCQKCIFNQKMKINDYLFCLNDVCGCSRINHNKNNK